MAFSSTCVFDVREDGVYAIIDNIEGAERIQRRQLMFLAEEFGVTDIDLDVVSEIFSDMSSHIEKRITTSTRIKERVVKDESIIIETTADHMQATIKFVEPLGGGKLLTIDDIKFKLQEHGIKFGILEKTIPLLIDEKQYNEKLVVAKGEPAVHGTDGTIRFHVDVSGKAVSPKVLDSGKVDFRELGLIKMANKNETLVSATPPTEGVHGMDVFGRPIEAKAGKPAPPLPVGKNVFISDDGLTAKAACDGQILYVAKKISISPILEIKGNVDNSTGNIDFNGAVVIKGTVLSGFVVKAVGNIEVYGVVEGAKLKSEGHIFLYNGIQGSERAVIEALGNVTAKFIESSNISADGDIVADSIMHSNIRCGGTLEVDGKKGLLVGGSIIVSRGIKAKNVGSTMATPTEIQVGHMPKEMEMYNKLKIEMDKHRKLYDDHVKIVNVLSAGNIADLPQDKKNILLRAINSKKQAREKMLSIQAQINDIMPDLAGNKAASIKVSGVIRSGVKVLIGNAMMYIRDDIQNCMLINKEGKISIQSYV